MAWIRNPVPEPGLNEKGRDFEVGLSVPMADDRTRSYAVIAPMLSGQDKLTDEVFQRTTWKRDPIRNAPT